MADPKEAWCFGVMAKFIGCGMGNLDGIMRKPVLLKKGT
jgi:hypothetical protein